MNSTKKTQPAWRIAIVATATLLALGACKNANEEREAAIAAQMAEFEPLVEVVTVQPENVLLETELTGRLEAIRTATIVPQVNGIVKSRLFEEGSFVQAGQPLYQLEDASHSASLESARAQLLTAQAALAKADADVARYRPLLEADAISKQEWDAAVAAKRSAEALVASAQAAIKSSQVNVRHARITAPISGFISQSEVSEGALVSAGVSKMATIRQTDLLYVNITQSASEIMKLRNQLVSGERSLNENLDVGIVFEDGTEYGLRGQLLFADPTVDETTGQVSLRALVPNPDNVLMSGLFVRVRLPLAGVLGAYVVPQQAVTRGKNDTVTVVTAEGKLEPRTVSITGQKAGNWVISEGLNPGDQVAVNGTMISGMLGAQKVKTQEWQAEDAAFQAADEMSVPEADASEAAQEAPAQ